MSYSFTITERTKAEAVSAVWERLNDIATTQASHRLDLDALQTASRALIMAVADDPGQAVRVVMSGWVNARGQLSDERAVGVQTSIQVSQVDHPAL
jgi:hypothetical protein